MIKREQQRACTDACSDLQTHFCPSASQPHSLYLVFPLIQEAPSVLTDAKRLPGAFISPVDSSLDLYEPSVDNLRVIYILLAQLSETVKAFFLFF